MNVDLDEKEIEKLLISLGMYQTYIKEETNELKELVKLKKPCKQQGFCCLQFSEESEEDKLLGKIKDDDNICQKLRDKLKMTQMKFPSEEHKYKQYDYGKVFGYEKATWIEGNKRKYKKDL